MSKNLILLIKTGTEDVCGFEPIIPPLRLHLKKELIKVEDIGVEPMTLCVQGRCSSQLS